MSDDIIHLLHEIFQEKNFISATLSQPLKKDASQKVTFRALYREKGLVYQITEHKDKKDFHRTLLEDECLQWFIDHIHQFKQSHIFTQKEDIHFLNGKKGHCTLLRKSATKSLEKTDHNRKKMYLIAEGEPLPFLIELGIMDKQGNIAHGKGDKFRQINRFLEIVDDLTSDLKDESLHIVDFGCGKAYLTFALHYFFKTLRKRQVQLIGIDLKKDVIAFCQKLSQKLGIDHEIQFIEGNINDFVPQHKVNLCISLHACDTATDAALGKAIQCGAETLLSVPCCHHELLGQISQEQLTPLMTHGILKERFSSLATDAARALLLETCGYHTQVIEFIDPEYTAKNILIRAVLKKSFPLEAQKQKHQEYLDFKHFLHISPTLEKILQDSQRENLNKDKFDNIDLS